MEKRKEIIILVFLIFLFFTINYSFLDKGIENFLSDFKIVKIDRVIDGDTVKFEEDSIRLLGINSPEKNEKYYSEAKEFLEEMSLNKTVRLEFGKEKYDRYKRILAYIFINGENANLKLVEEGLANFYFPSGKDSHYNEFKEAWENCIEKNKNLCERSENICSECIELKEFNYNNQELIFYNKCDFNCELTKWNIKDEGRKNFFFHEFVLESKEQVKITLGEESNTKKNLFWKNEEYVWTSTGDTLFLRDDEGKLVLWETY